MRKNLGAAVNTTHNEWAPMLSPDGRTLLFASDGYGAGRMDLITSQVVDSGFTAAVPLRGEVNTPGSDTYAPMLEWSRRGQLTFTTRRPAKSADGADLYVLKYRP